MLTRKILTLTVFPAITLSIAMLAGCPVSPVGTGTVTLTPSAAVTATVPVSTPTALVTATPPTTDVTSNPVGQTASPYPTTEPTIYPGQTSCACDDFPDWTTFNGKVYDPDGITVDGAIVIAKSVDPNVSWVGQTQVSTNGAYVFRNAPIGARIEIYVSKAGWTSRVRTEVLKSNLTGDSTGNIFDFGGLGTTGLDKISSYYSIQDEPEISSLKINGIQVNDSGGFPISSGTSGAPPTTTVPNNGRFGFADLTPVDGTELKTSARNGLPLTVGVTGIYNYGLDIELGFSEPVDRESVQNNFKIISQDFAVRQNIKSFEIDKNLSQLTFTWAADDKTVLIKTNKAILTTNILPEAKYLIKWLNPFLDKTGKKALKVNEGRISPTGHFRYNPGIDNDFNVFSVQIDDQAPKLLSVEAIDGTDGGNDIIRMDYNESLDVIGQISPAFGLVDPTDASNSADKQLWAYNTANSGSDPKGGDGTTFNQATVVGYSQGGTAINDFKGVYMIARLPLKISTKNDVITMALAQGQTINGANVNTLPSGGNPATSVGTGSLLRSAAIDDHVVTLEFAPEAFKKNEKIIVSVGKNISSSYQDTSGSFATSDVTVTNRSTQDPALPSYSEKLTDPAGNAIVTGNITNSGNFRVDDSLKVVTAN